MKAVFSTVLLFVLVGVCVGALTMPTMDYSSASQTDATRQLPYMSLSTVTEDATALTASTKYWDSIKTYFIPMKGTCGRAEIGFYAYGDGTGDGDPNGATFNFKVYACRPYSCPKTVYQGTAVVGELELSCDPVTAIQYNSGALDPNESYKWVDTIDANGVGDVWISSVVLSGDAGTDSTGEIATLSFDLNGYFGVWCEITAMTSQSVTQVWAVISGY